MASITLSQCGVVASSSDSLASILTPCSSGRTIKQSASQLIPPELQLASSPLREYATPFTGWLLNVSRLITSCGPSCGPAAALEVYMMPTRPSAWPNASCWQLWEKAQQVALLLPAVELQQPRG
jgi:hypothetical protein